MNSKKAKALGRIAHRISRGENPDAIMKVKKDAIREEFTKDDGSIGKRVVKNAKFQRTLIKTGKRSIKRRLKKLYVQKKIRLTITKNS